MFVHPPSSTLFPYTSLFRSGYFRICRFPVDAKHMFPCTMRPPTGRWLQSAALDKSNIERRSSSASHLSRLSVLKGSDLAPKALLQLQPGASPQGFDYAITSAESALQSAWRIKRVSE